MLEKLSQILGGKLPEGGFEKIFLRISGMRSTREYEILSRGEEAELAEYEKCYGGEEGQRRLMRRALCPTSRIHALLEECRVMNWDGFVGKHPSHVSDGDMFSFCMQLRDGSQVRAEGSANFPKHFREFRGELHTILEEGEEAHSSS